MHPPEWVVSELENLHSQARLGWLGVPDEDDPEEEKELNRGTFVLLQLYLKKDVERIPTSTPWRLFPCAGPVFGKRWDPLEREPVALAHIAPKDVFSGKVLAIVKEWMRPAYERVVEDAKIRGSNVASRMEDNSRAAADWFWWAKNKSPFTTPSIPKKFITEAEKKYLAGEDSIDLKKAYLPDGHPNTKSRLA
jgi:hypothetical protein